MDELKPCPFGCSGHQVAIIPTGFGTWNVRCEECYIDGPESDTKILAAKAWNTRPETSTLTPKCGQSEATANLTQEAHSNIGDVTVTFPTNDDIEKAFGEWYVKKINNISPSNTWKAAIEWYKTSTPTPKCGQSEAKIKELKEALTLISAVLPRLEDDVQRVYEITMGAL